jgi:hypothetical protein
MGKSHDRSPCFPFVALAHVHFREDLDLSRHRTDSFSTHKDTLLYLSSCHQPTLAETCLSPPTRRSSQCPSPVRCPPLLYPQFRIDLYLAAAAPAAIGPYSQAVAVGDLLFVSGCIPLVPSTMEIVEGGIKEQTKQALSNLKAVVEGSGSEIGKVAKTTVGYISCGHPAELRLT